MNFKTQSEHERKAFLIAIVATLLAGYFVVRSWGLQFSGISDILPGNTTVQSE